MRHMRKLMHCALAALAIGATAATALTNPPTFAPRYFQTQQTHYLRFTVNFNSCVLVSNTCAFKIGSVPYNTMILRAAQQIITSFNSGTTDTLALGTSSGGAQLVAAQSVHGAAGALGPLTLVSAGINPTGNGATQTGTDGGFDVWVTYAQTGAAPSAGQAVIIMEFAAPNDGACAPVPNGATAAAC